MWNREDETVELISGEIHKLSQSIASTQNDFNESVSCDHERRFVKFRRLILKVIGCLIILNIFYLGLFIY
jgi:hypothetical protein